MEASEDRQDVWYAFVESDDRLRSSRGRSTDPAWLREALRRRDKFDMRPPNRVVWLSCIRTAYFDALSWIAEPCDIGDEGHAERRRARLLSLDDQHLLVVPLLLAVRSRGEYSVFASLGRHDWHRIRLWPGGTFPVWTAPDFDLERDGSANQLDYLAACSDAETQSLRRVFNLDFLQDELFGGESERGPPASPHDPPPDPGAKATSQAAKEETRLVYSPPLKATYS